MNPAPRGSAPHTRCPPHSHPLWLHTTELEPEPQLFRDHIFWGEKKDGKISKKKRSFMVKKGISNINVYVYTYIYMCVFVFLHLGYLLGLRRLSGDAHKSAIKHWKLLGTILLTKHMRIPSPWEFRQKTGDFAKKWWKKQDKSNTYVGKQHGQK